MNFDLNTEKSLWRMCIPQSYPNIVGESMNELLYLDRSIFMDFFAYLDAGTGSMILQAVAAGAVGVLVFVKAFWHRIKNLFTRKSDKSSDEPTE